MNILVIPTSQNPNNRMQKSHQQQIKELVKDVVIEECLPGDEEYTDALKNAEVVITQNLGVINLKDAPQLKWIHMTSAGVNNLTEELKESDVIISNSSGVHPVPISEHVLTMMLVLTRNLDGAFRNQIEKKWDRYESDRTVDELTEKTVCIVGLGQIGERVAKLCQAFEMKTIGVVRNTEQKRKYVEELFGTDDLLKAIKDADFVVNCLPGTPETKHLFDKKVFTKFKKGSYFINIGRGTTVDEKALQEALTNGTLAGAGLDVFETEPLSASNPLWKLNNIIITPHISGWSPKSGEKTINIFCENLKAYLNKKKLPNLVNKGLGY